MDGAGRGAAAVAALADWAGVRAESARVAAAWRRSAPRRALDAAVDAAAAAAADLPCAEAQARALLADDGWVADLIAPLVGALAAAPLIDVPLRVARTGGRMTAVLLEHPAARVTAAIVPAAARAQVPDEVILSGRVALTRYVHTGGATLLRWHGARAADPFLLEREPPLRRLADTTLHDGAVVRLDGRCESHVLHGGGEPALLLGVVLHAGKGPVVRAFARDDGRILRACSTDEGGSRAAMLLTLLRVTGRRDAGPVFDTMTRDAAFHQRWGAMREWLALDAAAAWPRLAAMAADDPHPEVRVAAAAVLARGVARRAA